MAQKKRKLLKSLGFFQLHQVVTERGRELFLISVSSDMFWRSDVQVNVREIANFLDPHHNRGSQLGMSWRFRSRKQAEEMLTLAVLRWC